MADITDIAETKRVPFDSAIDVTLGGTWVGLSASGQPISGNVVSDDTGTVLPQASHTAFVSLYQKKGTVLLVDHQPMTTWLNPPGCWMGTLPATALVGGTGPLRRIIEVHGPNGLLDTLYGTWKADYVESSGAR